MSDLDNLKRKAAEKAVEFIKSGMILGLGTGSTFNFVLELLSEKLKNGDEMDRIHLGNQLKSILIITKLYHESQIFQQKVLIAMRIYDIVLDYELGVSSENVFGNHLKRVQWLKPWALNHLESSPICNSWIGYNWLDLDFGAGMKPSRFWVPQSFSWTPGFICRLLPVTLYSTSLIYSSPRRYGAWMGRRPHAKYPKVSKLRHALRRVPTWFRNINRIPFRARRITNALRID